MPKNTNLAVLLNIVQKGGWGLSLCKYKTPMVGDAQAEEPVVEGARSEELQGFEKRAQGCQPSQGETSNMKLLEYIFT